MRKHSRRISSALVAAVSVAGLSLGTACGSDESSTPAPTGEATTESKTPQEKTKEPQSKTPQEKPKESPGKSERADLVRFELDDRSSAGFTNIYVVWTIKNNSTEKSDYSWDWEAVNASGTRVENSTEFVTDVQPGQTTTGEYPTTLKTTDGIKLNITSFQRTASF
ncbi:hypothetical protein OHA61_33975 [Streptomyces sp. NBC_00885]|uniref:hypothetical protein n=1 Tax=Streptomyces sp. NBC_00885 TaxID=2975857 RepID=UPI003867E573|nr:hypothetical protein OHA61_33975 [Streptomyces sp. NBC_00885]